MAKRKPKPASELKRRAESRLRVSFEVRRCRIPNNAFGAYQGGSAHNGAGKIWIDFDAIFWAVADPKNALPLNEWKAFAADTIVHEMLHGMQDILGEAFKEMPVEDAIRRARESILAANKRAKGAKSK